MELVAPFQKTHLMITLSQYNSEDKPILATAEVHKDQAFFPANTNTYIAASSFRISGFGDQGYIYQHLQPSWFISGEVMDTDVSLPGHTWTPTGVAARAIQFNSNIEEEDVHQIEIVMDSSKMQPENSLNDHLVDLAKDFNAFNVTQGAVLRFYDSAEVPNKYEPDLRVSPAEQLYGPGEGEKGLMEIRAELFDVDPFATNIQIKLDANGKPERFGIVMRVLQRELPPDYTDNDLRRYLSRGLYMFPSRVDEPLYNNFTGPMFEILGPVTVRPEADLVGSVGMEMVDEDYSPQVRLWCDKGEMISYDSRSMVNYKLTPTSNTKQGQLESTSRYILHEKNGETLVKVCVTWASPEAKAVGLQVMDEYINNTGGEFGGLGGLSAWYFLYRDPEPLSLSIRSKVPCTLRASGPQDPDLVFQEPTLHPISLEHSYAGRSHSLIGRTWADTKTSCMTPNEMYEIFNIKDPADPDTNPWFLQTHSNGGFTIKINKAFDNFKISKDFADALGLQPVIMRAGVVDNQRNVDTLNRLVVIRSDVPDDDGHAKVNWSDQNNFTENAIEDVSENFTTYDGRPITDEWCRTHILSVVRRIGVETEADSYYKILSVMPQKEMLTRHTRPSKHSAAVYTDPDDGDYYNWAKVLPGDQIFNTQEISVESFSLYEGIQIVCPSLPFSPMITSYSSGMRVLCEIRMAYNYTGNSDASGRVTTTSDEFVGDLVWNANNFQYLQLQSVGKIYNLECRAQYVFRDCNRIPPKPVMIPPRGIFQVKIRLLAVK